MMPYEEYSRLVKRAFANSGMLVTRRTGVTGPPTSEETQPTPSTPTPGTEIIMLPNRRPAASEQGHG